MCDTDIPFADEEEVADDEEEDEVAEGHGEEDGTSISSVVDGFSGEDSSGMFMVCCCYHGYFMVNLHLYFLRDTLYFQLVQLLILFLESVA